MTDKEYEMEKIEDRLKLLESRISRLESALAVHDGEDVNLSDEEVYNDGTVLTSEKTEEEEKGLESQIGRIGLAWLGNIVLLFGIIFMTQYLMIQGDRIFSVILGYTAAALMFFLAGYLKKTNDHLSFMFKMNAQVLMFYVTLRLYFFSASPILTNKTISVTLLLILIAVQAFISIKDKSQLLATLFIVFTLITGIICDTTFIILPIVALAAGASVYFYYRFKWEPLLVITIILSYSTAFLWLLGNPVMGHQMKLISEQNSGVIFVFLLGAVFSVTLLLRSNDKSSDSYLTVVTFVNGIFFSLLLVFVVLGFFAKNYEILFSVITICCLSYSIILHSRYDWNFASAFYALYGFMAMSIAFQGLLGFPRVFLLLSVQSLVVVSMALWFRNRLIAAMNTLLFLTILIAYLVSSKSINGVNFSFAMVSLISARIINWKKSRLHIETDLIRNLYLMEGFLMVLLALYHAVPKQFITLSWAIAALIYFLLGFVLKNVKYRYMALGTLICSAFYLFIVDLAHIEIIYRVLALLFLAALSIGLSIYYTNRIKKAD